MTNIDLKNPLYTLIFRLATSAKITEKLFVNLEREIAKSSGQPFYAKDTLVRAYREMVKDGIIQPNLQLEEILKLKRTRSLSGIVVVSLLTKPYPCPGQCLYCPSEPSIPKSYLAKEPAVARAINCGYDPYRQTTIRLKALENVGHPVEKINIRVIGATWSAYPKAYQSWFIRQIFAACDNYGAGQPVPRTLPLDQLQAINETSRCRIVEISIETRQDYITGQELKRLRYLGVTKVELGVQSIYDDVLALNRRGNSNRHTIEATRLLKDAGFKVSYQVMPNLPGSNPQRDLKMFQELFHDPAYQPDYLKIYPLALVKSAPVYQLYQQGQFEPYTKDELITLIKSIKQIIPRYCRIERIIRDIPTDEIVAGGAKISSLRQLVVQEMAKTGLACQCVRCRESREDYDPNKPVTLFREDYPASDGQEIFLTYESEDRRTLFSLLRLRIINQDSKPIFPALRNAAIIREMHTYGKQVSISTNDQSAAQHQGFGKRLLAEAERIARDEFGRSHIAAIAGVGAREYFRRRGYHLANTYMAKNLR